MSTNRIEMIRGDTKVLTITVTRDGQPYDLTGHTLWLTAKRTPTDADSAAVFQLSTTAGGITITNAAGGVARAEIAPTHTESLPAVVNRLVYDVQIADGTGGVYTVASGELVVRPDVTITRL